MIYDFNLLTLITSPPSQSGRNLRKHTNYHRHKFLYGRKGYRYTGKELDAETGLYYYGARYLDPRVSRWLSGDPAMGEYIPAPGQDPGKLRGIGGVYNFFNLHVYHYAANNPIKYIDPDGRESANVARWVREDREMRRQETLVETRAAIVMQARSFEGSTLWNTNVNREGIREGIDKCNIFVYEITNAAGASPGLPNSAGNNPFTRYRGGRNTPPLASQWADPNFEIPGWRVLSQEESIYPIPGDVVAISNAAINHVAIVTGEESSIGTNQIINPHAVRENNFGFRAEHRNFSVFRRWEGIE